MLSNHYPWYNFRDSELVRKIVQFENDCPYFTLVQLVGGAGTGKTTCLSKLVEVPRVHYMAPTTIAGGVLYDALHRKMVQVKCSQTIFKYYGENLNDDRAYKKILNQHIPSLVSAATHTNFKDMFDGLDHAFLLMSERRYEQANKRCDGYVTPIELQNICKEADKAGWFDEDADESPWYAQDFDKLAHLYEYVRATRCVPDKCIPNQLKYDTLVVDEAGRVDLLTILWMAYYHYYVREKFGYPKKVKLVLVGSATQNKVINESQHVCNDYSGITLISAPCFKNETYMTHLNSYNRRCNMGDVQTTTALITMIDRLEQGLPLTKHHKHEFISKFSVPNFIPTVDQIRGKPKETLGCVYMSKRHKRLTEVEMAIMPYMQKISVKEFFTPEDHSDAQGVPRFYGAHIKLGSGYNSIVYNNVAWEREELEPENDEKRYRYWNSRLLYLDTMYVTTHNCGVLLTSISGSVEDFLRDYDIYKYEMKPEAMYTLITCIIGYLLSIIDLLAIYTPTIVNKIPQLSQVWETLTSAANPNGEEKEAKNLQALGRMEMEVMMYLRVAAKAIPDGTAIPIVMSVPQGSNAWLNMRQGQRVVVTDVQTNRVIVQIGKTFQASMMRKKTRMNNTSVRDFDQTEGDNKPSWRHRHKCQKKSKRYRNEDEMEEDEMLRNIIQDTLEDIPDSDSAVICQFFPLRSTITITIDTAQSATFDFNHVLELCTNMPTEDLVVGATRLSDARQFKVYCADKDNWTLLPYPDITKDTIDSHIRNQKKNGLL